MTTSDHTTSDDDSRDAEPAFREFRCPGGHIAFEHVGRYKKWKCRQCSSKAGTPVYHFIDMATLEFVDPRAVFVILGEDQFRLLEAC